MCFRMTFLYSDAILTLGSKPYTCTILISHRAVKLKKVSVRLWDKRKIKIVTSSRMYISK